MVKVERAIRKGNKPMFNEKQVDDIVIKFNSGRSMKSIADELGVTTATISKYIKLRVEECENGE